MILSNAFFIKKFQVLLLSIIMLLSRINRASIFPFIGKINGVSFARLSVQCAANSSLTHWIQKFHYHHHPKVASTSITNSKVVEPFSNNAKTTTMPFVELAKNELKKVRNPITNEFYNLTLLMGLGRSGYKFFKITMKTGRLLDRNFDFPNIPVQEDAVHLIKAMKSLIAAADKSNDAQLQATEEDAKTPLKVLEWQDVKGEFFDYQLELCRVRIHLTSKDKDESQQNEDDICFRMHTIIESGGASRKGVTFVFPLSAFQWLSEKMDALLAEFGKDEISKESEIKQTVKNPDEKTVKVQNQKKKIPPNDAKDLPSTSQNPTSVYHPFIQQLNQLMTMNQQQLMTSTNLLNMLLRQMRSPIANRQSSLPIRFGQPIQQQLTINRPQPNPLMAALQLALLKRQLAMGKQKQPTVLQQSQNPQQFEKECTNLNNTNEKKDENKTMDAEDQAQFEGNDIIKAESTRTRRRTKRIEQNPQIGQQFLSGSMKRTARVFDLFD